MKIKPIHVIAGLVALKFLGGRSNALMPGVVQDLGLRPNMPMEPKVVSRNVFYDRNPGIIYITTANDLLQGSGWYPNYYLVGTITTQEQLQNLVNQFSVAGIVDLGDKGRP